PAGPASGDASQPHAPFIEAVEIDGRDVFVAGRAKPGHQVRVYFNDLLIGQTRATPAGRFLVQAERELPVGDYIVRADVLDEDGATVIARAAVPFERQTGDNVAAVAPGATRVEGGRPGAGVDGDSQGGEGAAGDGEADGTPGTAAGGEERTADLAPRLEPADGSVIIRRGDTLWEISRRVYGRGVRYTTIYLANQDQIEDPDLIWPGQIFNLPEETEEGEAADLSAIGEQAVQPSEPVRESSR
ncbi:LysM peptidoglycan-binding domain-containing protein, partial [Nitratireductor sp. GCM10026969]|uniref:LysM peptidoglycan-binding domain-containing protein n=1 Tax=Nitratireductor sp. GCM10026969 TaxID=3252645 RepID=UPI0036095646